MKGWNGAILRVDLTEKKHSVQRVAPEFAAKWVGGRGFAARIIWEEVPAGADPLGPHNVLVLAAGPLTGLTVPSSGKMVVAAKSPLTGGYGDGNIGSMASVELRKAGYDAIVVKGASSKPVVLVVEDGKVSFEQADDLWGLDTFTAERRLRERYGRTAGILLIGQAGENLVRYATVVSQEGRSAGRPGMGAVMGSKKLKAVVVKGTGRPEIHDPEELARVGAEAYRAVKESSMYDFWMRQGTMLTIQWSQENSVLPAYNFSEGVFDEYRGIDGYKMEEYKVGQRSCPLCNMSCGNVVTDADGLESELDYENVAMLGSNIGLGDLRKVAVLNRLADMYGIDTISLGNSIGFAMELSEKGILQEKVEWGDFEAAKQLLEDIVHRRGLGEPLSLGVRRAAERLGGDASKYAVHVKGLEVSAYECHAAPGMALAYATSPIGAHHKDAWVIAWETKTDRLGYGREKAEKVVEFQRIRGGMFESIVACRLPWIEIGLNLEYYPKLFHAATGVAVSLEGFNTVADRIYAQIRAFWVREYGGWSREMDTPPRKWFETRLTKGPFKGASLDPEKYQRLLDYYYEIRGWDSRGVPRRSTLEKLGLADVAEQLSRIVKLEP